MEDRFELTINELNHIYWAIWNYSEIIKDLNPGGAKRLIETKEKLWKQLSGEHKKIIHPERYTGEIWLGARLKK